MAALVGVRYVAAPSYSPSVALNRECPSHLRTKRIGALLQQLMRGAMGSGGMGRAARLSRLHAATLRTRRGLVQPRPLPALFPHVAQPGRDIDPRLGAPVP